MFATALLAANQTRFLQYTEVFGNRGWGNAKRLGELFHRCRSMSKLRKHRAPGAVAERREGLVEFESVIINH